MCEMITPNDINGLSMLNATFLDLSYIRLTIYSTGYEQDFLKPGDLPQRFGLLHNVEPLTERLVFLCFPLTFSQLLPLI